MIKIKATISVFVGRGFRGCGKTLFRAAQSGTGTLACAGFASLTVAAKPRVVVLLDFFRNLFRRDIQEH
jgi:hypothetical protein